MDRRVDLRHARQGVAGETIAGGALTPASCQAPEFCCAMSVMFCTACFGVSPLASAEAATSLQVMFRSSPCLSSGLPQPQLAHIAVTSRSIAYVDRQHRLPI